MLLFLAKSLAVLLTVMSVELTLALILSMSLDPAALKRFRSKAVQTGIDIIWVVAIAAGIWSFAIA